MGMDEPQEEVREETPQGKRARRKEELAARFHRGNFKLNYLNEVYIIICVMQKRVYFKAKRSFSS